MSKAYNIIFKNETPKSVIDAEIADVKAKGGEIRQQYDSDFLKGFAATLPEDKIQALGNHEHMYVSLAGGLVLLLIVG